LPNFGPRLEEIEDELAALSELSERPSGTIRITADTDPAQRWFRELVRVSGRSKVAVRIDLHSAGVGG
jgi:DNA-binding transcriptional LysR family regulator